MNKREREEQTTSNSSKQQKVTEQAAKVAQHYNQRPQKSGVEREYSPIFQLKALNNYIKSILIHKYTREGDRVLDMCCGKGGDLLKYKKARISEMVGVDIARVSIEQAKERYNNGSFRFLAWFHVVDCFSQLLTEMDGWRVGFNVVSVQFGLHYAFESEDKLRVLLKNVSDNLLPNHYWIGTVPDSDRILDRLRESKELVFGNELYQIRFETKDETPYGHKYWFQLEDAIDDCPEFIVSFKVLEKVAKEYKLQITMKKGFHEFYHENIDRELVKRMKVLDKYGEFETNQWEIAGLYSVFAFERINNNNNYYESDKSLPLNTTVKVKQEEQSSESNCGKEQQ